MSEEVKEATVTDLPTQNMRDKIRNRPVSKGNQIEVPEWEVTVEFRSMSIAQKAELIGDDVEPSASKIMMALPEAILFTCYEPGTDEPIFTAEDLDWLKDEDASLIERLAEIGMNVSGLGEDAGDEGKGDS